MIEVVKTPEPCARLLIESLAGAKILDRLGLCTAPEDGVFLWHSLLGNLDHCFPGCSDPAVYFALWRVRIALCFASLI